MTKHWPITRRRRCKEQAHESKELKAISFCVHFQWNFDGLLADFNFNRQAKHFGPAKITSRRVECAWWIIPPINQGFAGL